MHDLIAVYAHSSHVLTLVVQDNLMSLGCAVALANARGPDRIAHLGMALFDFGAVLMKRAPLAPDQLVGG
jgi:hypothetical protein